MRLRPGWRIGGGWGLAAALLLAALALAVPGDGTPPRSLQGRVERVADGDTLTARTDNQTRLRVRLLGIDAPEIPHGRAPGQPFGPEAHAHLEGLVGNRTVRIETFGPDAYRRVLGVVWVGETNVNLSMVRAGLAEVYRGARCQAYCQELEAAERRAQRDRIGMWAHEPYESPAAYRRRLRHAGNGTGG